jgi:hypothetical protein
VIRPERIEPTPVRLSGGIVLHDGTYNSLEWALRRGSRTASRQTSQSASAVRELREGPGVVNPQEHLRFFFPLANAGAAGCLAERVRLA